MPYPIGKLAYGLSCRLNDLSTPAERYKLQIAAGNASICPGKLQIVQENLQNLSFGCRNETVLAFNDVVYNIYHIVSTPIDTVNDNIFVYDGHQVLLFDLTAEASKSDIFDHFVFNAYTLLIRDCHFSKPFYEMVKVKFSNTAFLRFLATVTMNSINFTDLLTALPNVKHVYSDRCHNANWISEILQVKKHSLMMLSLRYASVEECDEFDHNQLLTFLKAQRSGFELHLNISIAIKKVPFFKKLINFVDRKLFRGSGPRVIHYDSRIKQARTTLHICGIKLDRMYYLPLEGDNVQVGSYTRSRVPAL